jgi:sulfur relay (sulfurtransferase) DsrC/TusE family protein
MCLTLTENFNRAITLVERHYSWTETTRNAFSHFRFFRAASLLFEILAERGGPINVNLPRSFPLYSETGAYDSAQLAAWFKQKAATIAQRFDERNETDFFMRTIAETHLLKDLLAPFPLAAPA